MLNGYTRKSYPTNILLEMAPCCRIFIVRNLWTCCSLRLSTGCKLKMCAWRDFWMEAQSICLIHYGSFPRSHIRFPRATKYSFSYRSQNENDALGCVHIFIVSHSEIVSAVHFAFWLENFRRCASHFPILTLKRLDPYISQGPDQHSEKSLRNVRLKWA